METTKSLYRVLQDISGLGLTDSTSAMETQMEKKWKIKWKLGFKWVGV